MAKKLYTSIQQWIADKGFHEPVNGDPITFSWKEFKTLLFGLWRDRQVEVDYWKRKYKNLLPGYKKLQNDMKILNKRMRKY